MFNHEIDKSYINHITFKAFAEVTLSIQFRILRFPHETCNFQIAFTTTLSPEIPMVFNG